MPRGIVLYLLLFAAAVATVHFVSWVGSVLHSVPNGGNSSYAVFTFRSDRCKPMSTNILMNVLVPNVLLVVISLICYRLQLPYRPGAMAFYVAFYYVYRLFLICVILRRRELCSFGYELTNIGAGIAVALLLTKYFLVNPQELFIPVSELVNEFWLVIIVLVYKFAVLLLDKIFNQKTVVSERALESYIYRRFDRFYEKYAGAVNITREDRNVWILLFSVMIFENYNRGSYIRALERLKVKMGKTATVGIMQVKADRSLSDEESIAKAYHILRESMGGSLELDDEMTIKNCAMEYNPDEDYGESVAFIYQHLKEYLELMPKYRRAFYLGKEEEPPSAACAQPGYYTMDDLSQMTNLDKQEIRQRIEQENMTVLLLEDEVNAVFKNM